MPPPASPILPKRIVLVAPPWYPVPPDGYGGIELVVALLADQLRALGHHVTLIAAEGSDGALEVAPRRWGLALGQPTERLRELAYGARVLDALRHMERPDVIHDHTGYATLLGLATLGAAPLVHTVHGVLGEPERTFLEALHQRVGLVSISRTQRTTAAGLDWLGTVHNAVDVDALERPGKGRSEGYLLCLARICPEKGQEEAIAVARRTGRRLVLAGKVEDAQATRHHYATRIAPHVDGDRVVHVHNVSGRDKARLLARAAALLAPSRWEEPFGLAIAEAMASGTPAIAFARGAAPELISEGRTGFVVGDVDEMVGAVDRVAEIDRARCAAEARARFHPAVMADAYLALYARAANAGAEPSAVA